MRDAVEKRRVFHTLQSWDFTSTSAYEYATADREDDSLTISLVVELRNRTFPSHDIGLSRAAVEDLSSETVSAWA